MNPFAETPQPPYYAVIFTSRRTPGEDGYAAMAARMVTLAQQQPGFLGMESAKGDLNITVSYWRDLDSIAAWKQHAEHAQARDLGREHWYEDFQVRIAKVERDYGWSRPDREP